MDQQIMQVEIVTHADIRRAWIETKPVKVRIPGTIVAEGNTEARRLLQVEIDAATLLQLLKGRRLCASDIRCLDCESKRCLMRLLLRACAQDMDEDEPVDNPLITG